MRIIVNEASEVEFIKVTWVNVSWEGNEMKQSLSIKKKHTAVSKSTDWLEIWYSWGAYVRYCVKLLKRESDHKPLYNVEKMSGAIIVSFYMSVRGI